MRTNETVAITEVMIKYLIAFCIAAAPDYCESLQIY